MSSPLLILLAGALYGLVHSWLASLQAKEMARRLLGAWFERTYRLAYNFFAGISLLPLLALTAMLPDQHIYTIPLPWSLLTLAGQALAALALVLGLLQTGAGDFLGLRQLFGGKEAQKTTLVSHGLYRWVRHPLYTAGLVFIWLSPVMTVNLLALFFSLSIYLVVGAHFEERKLSREFGEQYRQYQSRTPMLIPRLPKRVFKV